MIRNLNIIENYFENLASSHKKLRHGENGRKAYYKLTADESSAIFTNAAEKALHIEGYFGRYTGNAENINKPVSLILKILVKSEGTSESQKDVAYDTAEEIMDDIIAKLAHDNAAQCDCFDLYNIDFTSIAFDRVGPEGQNSYGYRLTIPLQGNGPVFLSKNWIS